MSNQNDKSGIEKVKSPKNPTRDHDKDDKEDRLKVKKRKQKEKSSFWKAQ
jgi:hypothetical protein